jgi:hypothetical protein
VDPFQAAYAPPFTAEEYAEMERQGIPLPLPTRYLQEQGIIRRPGEELPPSSILQRGLGALALGGLLAGSPGAAVAGTGGLIVHNAFQGPALGPSQLRIPAATRRASFSNRAAVREFHHRDPTYATGAGFGTNSTAATLNVRNNRYPSRPSSSVPGKMKATLGSPPGLEDADVRNGPSGAMRYPRPNRRGTANNNRRNGNYRRNVARDPWVPNPRAAEAVARQRAADVEKNEQIAAATNAILAERAAAAAAPPAAAAAPPAAAPPPPPAPAPAPPPAPPAPSFFNSIFRFNPFGGSGSSGGARRTRNVRKNKRSRTMRKIIKN